MGSYFDLDKTLELYKVRNRWQRSFVVFMWQHRLHEDQLPLRVLYLNCCGDGEPRMKSIETECRRFYKFNKTFVHAEHMTVDSKSLQQQKEYFTKLLQQKHYMLAFSVSNLLIRHEDIGFLEIFIHMLDLLDDYK